MDSKSYWKNKGEVISRWSDFLGLVRKFFRERGFKEVQTPTLVPSSGSETHLHPLKVGGFYLPTSPEFHLKRALVAGLDRIYEIRSCFRGREDSPAHATEFTMLEWYRTNAGALEIKQDVNSLFKLINQEMRNIFQFDGELEESTMSALFKRFLNFNLTVETTSDELQTLARSNQLHTHNTDTWNDLFHRLFIEFIEPHIGLENPIVVIKFPKQQAALARLDKEGWAERFEVYFRGLEIANAYDELTDPEEYLRRFQQWNKEKKLLGYDPVPIDEVLIEALQVGLPPSGGIALGLERLFMAFFKIKNIREVQVL